MTSADYGFEAGELTRNPFDPNAISDPVFQAESNRSASYDLDFLNLGGGFRIGAEISKRFSTEVAFRVYVLGRYDGTGDLGNHGLVFIHSFQHNDPAFHVPGCGGVVPCGLVDVDLQTRDLQVEQASSRSRGLDASVSFDYRITDWFGVAAGLHRSFVRSVGGEEKRIVGGFNTCNLDLAAGTPPPPSTRLLAECGALNKAELISD